MTAITDDNIIGFFASFNGPGQDQDQVKAYLWGDNGLKNRLKSLKWQNFGQDFHLILFQFYVNPIPYEREHLREIESYRRKEKAIGIPVILDEENFFKLNEVDRQKYLADIILNKLDLLREKVKRNKLDLNISQLKNNIEALLNSA
jgi:hypothetical protein